MMRRTRGRRGGSGCKTTCVDLQNLGALQIEVARLAFSRVARGPVLGLAFLAAVASFAAMAGVETGFGLRRAAMADITVSTSVSRTSSVIIPVRPLTFDVTILSEAASTTDSESRRVEVQLASTVGATPPLQPTPDPRVAVKARHVVGPSYRHAVHGIDFRMQTDEALTAGQIERA